VAYDGANNGSADKVIEKLLNAVECGLPRYM
jgi:hypothetical protein